MLDHRLLTFIALAEIKNFTQTAERLNLTQPAVSQHIKILENHYQTNLIKKKSKSFQLTEEGRLLYQYAKKMQALNHAFNQELKNNANQHHIYSIGATMTIGDYILPHLIKKHKDLYPQTDLLLQVNNTEEIINKTAQNKLDLALIEGSFPKEKFCSCPFAEDELVLAAAPNNDFASHKEITLQEILSGKLILREKGSGTRDIFEKHIQAHDYNLTYFHPYMEIGSINAIKSLVEANIGYTVISLAAIQKELADHRLITVPIANLKIKREFTFIYLPENENSFIQSFIEFCLKYTNKEDCSQ
ncbi:MAG: LysR family transcriptional regulator [bacterium]